MLVSKYKSGSWRSLSYVVIWLEFRFYISNVIRAEAVLRRNSLTINNLLNIMNFVQKISRCRYVRLINECKHLRNNRSCSFDSCLDNLYLKEREVHNFSKNLSILLLELRNFFVIRYSFDQILLKFNFQPDRVNMVVCVFHINWNDERN